MTYYFGDGSPFPLDENVVETLARATEACVALFLADLAVANRRAVVDLARGATDRELDRLDSLARWVESALDPVLPKGDGHPNPGSQEAAVRIRESARRTVRQTKSRLTERRNAAARRAIGAEVSDRVRRALAPLLLSHRLPRSRWSVRWTAAPRTSARGEARATMPHGLYAVFTCDVSRGFWARPLDIGALAGDLRVPVPGRRGRLKTTSLSKYIITEVESSTAGEFFRVQPRGRKAKAGFVVILRTRDRKTPMVLPVSADGRRTGGEVLLAGDAVDQVMRLWTDIQVRTAELIDQRNTLQHTTLNGTPVTETERPAHIAQVILRILARPAREMRKRSSITGRIMLRAADPSGGPGEPIVFPVDRLRECVLALPERYRGPFAPLGLAEPSEVPTAVADASAINGNAPPRVPAHQRLATERIPTEPLTDFHITVDDTDSSAA